MLASDKFCLMEAISWSLEARSFGRAKFWGDGSRFLQCSRGRGRSEMGAKPIEPDGKSCLPVKKAMLKNKPGRQSEDDRTPRGIFRN